MTEPGPAAAAKPATLRLFFALWPDDATRAALNRTGNWLHQHWGGRRMRADTLHLTLAFLGSTPAGQLDELAACADTVQADAFELLLDRPGYWRHNRIGWLGASRTPPHYAELAGALNAALQAAGYSIDAPCHPVAQHGGRRTVRMCAGMLACRRFRAGGLAHRSQGRAVRGDPAVELGVKCQRGKGSFA